MHARVISVICVLLAIATVAQSRRWFAREINCWIMQKKVSASWEDAQQYCERHGAILASPLNTQLFDYMQSLINVHNHSAAYFIGTRANRSDDDQEAHYVSVEGRRLDDMPSAVFDAIEQLDLEQGDCLSMDRNGIRAVSCEHHLPYVCYSNETTECGSVFAPSLTSNTSVSQPSSSSSTIPPGYSYKPATRSFYKFHKSAVSWYEASTRCASEGAYLVTLDDVKERRIIGAFVKESVGHITTWTGVGESRLGGVRVWRVAHGKPVSEVIKAWYQPLQGGGKHCAALTSNFGLAFFPCDDAHYFTCEISQ